MSEIEDLRKDIEILREKLELLIKEKAFKLNDPEIIAASQILNAALNKYNNFIEKKLK